MMAVLKLCALIFGAAIICVGCSITPEARQGVLSANGLKIAYSDRGSVTDPTILFIQGVGAQTERGPDPIADPLVAARFRWVTFDNRDSGGSTHFTRSGTPDYEAIQRAAAEGRPLPLAYTVENMADDAIGVLDALNIDKAHIVGGSLGGVIAQVVAAKYPDRVLSLTLISTTTGNPDLALGPAVDMLAMPVPKTQEGRIAHDVALELRLIGPRQQIDALELRRRVEARHKRDDPEATARQGVAISGDQRASNRAIRAPTEVIHGALDPLFPPAHGADVSASISGAELTLVPNMGHIITDALAPMLVEAIMQSVLRSRGAKHERLR